MSEVRVFPVPVAILSMPLTFFKELIDSFFLVPPPVGAGQLASLRRVLVGTVVGPQLRDVQVDAIGK
ncbi:MAG: hypothetical protein U5K37_11715 [Natrialbaceae archaeon]|nr:hypothetical protein [Natrialbaceae archaeon]